LPGEWRPRSCRSCGSEGAPLFGNVDIRRKLCQHARAPGDFLGKAAPVTWWGLLPGSYPIVPKRCYQQGLIATALRHPWPPGRVHRHSKLLSLIVVLLRYRHDQLLSLLDHSLHITLADSLYPKCQQLMLCKLSRTQRPLHIGPRGQQRIT
jgi:hypothetical protein